MVSSYSESPDLRRTEFIDEFIDEEDLESYRGSHDPKVKGYILEVASHQLKLLKKSAE